MYTLVCSEGIEAASPLRDYIIQRLNFLLKPFEGEIEQITVHLENRDSSEPEAQRTCWIVAKLPSKTLMVEEQNSHFSVALDVALKRLIHKISNSVAAEREAVAAGHRVRW